MPHKNPEDPAVPDNRRRWKSYLVGLTMSALVVGLGAVTLPSTADAASQLMAATTHVNMRSGPGTSNRVLKVLSPKEQVTATGQSSGAWLEVTAGSLTGWVHKDYLSAVASTVKAAGSVTTTGSVNVRTGPGLDHPVVATVPGGTTLEATGEKTAEWTQVIHEGEPRWMFTQFLAAGKQALPAIAGQVRTTANLYLRTGGDLSHPYTGVLPGNSVVDTTGRTTSDYTEIVHNGAIRWIATRYTTDVTASQPSAPTTPEAKGKMWVNVGSMYLRETSAADGKIVATVSRGTELPVTGKTEGDRTQVIYQGVERWAYTAFLSKSAPAPAPKGVTLTGYNKLNKNSKAVVAAVVANFPKVNTIHGWRSSSAYSSDHPNGRAVDIMIPDWKGSGVQYGTEVAEYFKKNAGKYRVRYIIWRQRVWNVAYPARGWRAMENRGSATANHYDHVHVSVYD